MAHPSRHTRQHKRLAELRGRVIDLDLDRRMCFACRPGVGLCHRHTTRFRGVVHAITSVRRDQAVTGVAA